MIEKISDIQIGKEYFIMLEKDEKYARRAIVKKIVNEKINFISKQTEVLIDILEPKRMKGTTLQCLSNIGIGKTKIEAFNNYGRFTFEENPSFSSHHKI